MNIHDEPWAAERGPKTSRSGCKVAVVGLIFILALAPCAALALLASGHSKVESQSWQIPDRELTERVAPFFEPWVVEFFAKGRSGQVGEERSSWQGRHWYKSRRSFGPRGSARVQIHVEVDEDSREVTVTEAWLDLDTGETYDLLEDADIETPGLRRLRKR